MLGELAWSRRRSAPVPRRHRIAPWSLTGLNAAGAPVVVRGLVAMDGPLVLAGLAVHMSGKIWFLDRMVWLYEDVTGAQASEQRGEPDAIADCP